MIEFDPILVHDWLRRSARRNPDKVALVCGGRRFTYRDIDRQTEHLAAVLVQRGLRRQDRVVILLDNSPETVIGMYATLKAGGVFVVLAASTKGTKLRYVLDNSAATVLIAHTSKAAVVREAMSMGPTNPRVIWVGPMQDAADEADAGSLAWEDVFADLDAGRTPQVELPRTIDVDLACLIYTSGSTGQPKGVMSTHHNVVSAARSIISYIGNDPDDIILDVLPLSFDYGMYQVIMAFMFGGTVVLEKSFLYLHDVLGRIAQERVTGLPLVPTIAAMLLKMQNLASYDFRTLRYVTNTGAALPVEHIRRLRDLLPHVRIFSLFGLTECKRVGYMPPEHLDSHPGSVGRAMPNCETFIFDTQGRELGPGEIGELVIRGANVMQGYWQAPEQTAAAYRVRNYPADRLLFSGDYFRKDERGFLYFLGRKDDMIKSKGERISPREIEDALCRMPQIAEAAVIGVPDEILGQAIAAFLVPRPGTSPTERDVLKFCTENLESFMLPKYVRFSSDFPRTPNGKIDKKALKDTPLDQTA